MIGRWWLKPDGTAVNTTGTEHAQHAMAVMLNMDRKYAPMPWFSRGVPQNEIEAACSRGADPDALAFLSECSDPRLFAVENYGWVRVAGDQFNVWLFDEPTAENIRNQKEFWQQQARDGADLDHAHIRVTEMATGDQFNVSVRALLAGGHPDVLRNLAQARVDSAGPVERVSVHRPAGQFSEIERRRLARLTGDNPDLH